jgi:hypothetical protein
MAGVGDIPAAGREDDAFMSVEQVARCLAPRCISAMTCSSEVTVWVLSPSTNGPAAVQNSGGRNGRAESEGTMGSVPWSEGTN